MVISQNLSLQGQVFESRLTLTPGLKVDRSVKFYCVKLLYTPYVLCSLGFLKLNT